jgi:GH15 family glucan-1,4-alpha-glucosidase
MPYAPIEEHALIGNMHTAALVGTNGSLDWLCYPRFDSPSVFAAILDDDKGGYFQIHSPEDGVHQRQFYWSGTNVLVTRFYAEQGVGEVEDFMPISDRPEDRRRIVRLLRVSRGKLRFRVYCRPAFDYARATHTTEVTRNGVIFRGPDLTLGLSADVDFTTDEHGGALAAFTLHEGETMTFVLRGMDDDESCDFGLNHAEAAAIFEDTVQYWRGWVAQCTYTGRWRETVHRSALAMKLLTYEPTGAIVAAPTTSLPEHLGGVRNWDYRYMWIRDAAFTLYGFVRIGFTQEAAAFMEFLEARCRESEDGALQIMYGIDGRHDLPEEQLDHLDGYRGSAPVRIGNGAYDQLQLDIYGEMMDAVYLANKYSAPISYELWTYLRRTLNWLEHHWDQPDEGIWEVRGGQQNFTYSRLMCWVAFDRGIRLAEKRSFPAPIDRWRHVRDTIYEQIMERGFDAEQQAFVQAYGSDTLDASLLIMPLVFFMAPNDPRMLGTLRAIDRPVDDGGLVSDGLVYRYNIEASPDGLQGEEGTFNICTFWLVEAMTRAGRHDRAWLRKARLLFERMQGYANHLGLYAEETGKTGEHLGNFPQAFTHLSLISAAYNLDRTLNDAGLV